MAKFALVIGVSEYEPGLAPLPGALKDIEAVHRVLHNPDVGGFDEVKLLQNPEPQLMQEAIEALFSGRAKDDLVLLFFSGHGVKDDSGKLYLATRSTRKTPQGELIRATAVPARFVHDIMNNSRSKRQVVILDCCFSGAFADGWSAKDDGAVDVKTQLGGEGRAVLTSSTSTQYSFEQEGADLSTYTNYLIEGIETGAADIDNDGVVSIDELHEYARGKVHEAAPAMKPEIYAIKEGYKIHLTQAPIEDPKLRYRKEVELCASRGEISTVSRYTLDALRESLNLAPDEARVIEEEVLAPYCKYQQKLQRYQQVLAEALSREPSLSSSTREELKRLRRVLSLRDEDVEEIEVLLGAQKPAPPAQPVASVAEQPANPKTPAAPQSAPLASPRPLMLSANPGAALRNPKMLIGGGLAAAFLAALVAINGLMPERSQTTPSGEGAGQSSLSLSNAQDYYTRGESQYSKGDYSGAIESYTQAIELNPEHVEAHYGRGLAKHALDDYEGAIADYDKALELNPEYAQAYLERGNAKTSIKDYQGAIADYDQLLKLDPDNADAFYGRGVSKVLLGDNQRAIADYDKSIELNPNNAQAYYERGKSKYRLEEYEAAIADYDQALKLNPDYAEVYYERGVAKAILGDNQAAIADYDEALKLNPDDTIAYFERGKSKYRVADYQGAIADYNEAIVRVDDDADFYYEMGISKAALQDIQGAIEAYQKASQLYAEQGDTTSSQDALEQINALQ